MKEMLKWIDQQSQQKLMSQAAIRDAVDRKATAFLNLLLTGGAGSLAWAVSIWKESGALSPLLPAQVATAVAALWLFGVAALVMTRVLATADYYGPGYDAQPAADNLQKVEVDDDQWLRWMLDHRQQAIDYNKRRNDKVCWWFNRCQWLAVMTPVVIAVAAFAAAY